MRAARRRGPTTPSGSQARAPWQLQLTRPTTPWRLRLRRTPRSRPGVGAAMSAERDAAIAYADRGLAVFQLHEIRADGRCGCGDRDCDNAGKHPVSAGWPRSVPSVRFAEREWSRFPNRGIGLACGPALGMLRARHRPEARRRRVARDARRRQRQAPCHLDGADRRRRAPHPVCLAARSGPQQRGEDRSRPRRSRHRRLYGARPAARTPAGAVIAGFVRPRRRPSRRHRHGCSSWRRTYPGRAAAEEPEFQRR